MLTREAPEPCSPMRHGCLSPTAALLASPHPVLSPSLLFIDGIILLPTMVVKGEIPEETLQ